MSDERMPPLTDAEKVRLALEYGSEHTPALTREPVFVWTNAEAALDRLESQNQALQERAEKAEDLLRAVAFDDQHKLQVWLEPLYIREPYVKVLVDKATELLSPTQETDPE